MMMSGGKKALMNPCWEKLFIFTGKGYAHQRISPVNGIQIIEYFSAGCFILNEENECSALVDMFICHIGESLKVVFRDGPDGFSGYASKQAGSSLFPGKGTG